MRSTCGRNDRNPGRCRCTSDRRRPFAGGLAGVGTGAPGMINRTVRSMAVLAAVLIVALPAWASHEAAREAWDAGRTDEALALWQTAAADGDRRAMHALGRLYLQGLGVLQDYVEAHKWLNLAASRGEAAAQAERDALAGKMTPQQVAEAQALARAWRPSEGEAASATAEKTAAVEETAATAADSTSSGSTDDEPTPGPEPSCVRAEESTGCWKALADRPGCHVWDDRHVPERTATWSAQCSGGVIAGKGTLAWTRDGKSTAWTGTASDGKRQGFWVGRTADGGVEQGSFVDGDRHGHWVMRFAGGGGAEGPFAEGKRHGYWVIREPSGTMEGPYVDGRRHGHWVVRASSGNVSEGSYVGGKKQGSWVESRADGSLWMGPYVDDRKHGRWHRTGEQVCAFNEFDLGAVAGSGVLLADCPSLDVATEDGAVAGASHDGGELTAAAEEAEAVTPDSGQVDLAREKAERERKEREARERAAAERRQLARSTGHVFRDCKDCPEMVVVPAGSFMMGSPPNDNWRMKHDIPRHLVTIAAPFAVGRYEITFDEWDACVAAGGCGNYRPSDQGWGRGRRPVIHVSWHDAKAYTDWLSRKTGESYRLLSEAEWEYAARAGTTTRYSWGDKLGRNRANCKDCRSRRYNGQTAPVGSFPANRFGLHDVHGNVYEWVEDCVHESYRGAPSNGSAWISGGECSMRIMRGGAWYAPYFTVLSFQRNWSKSGTRISDGRGFRVARTLVP